MKPFLFVVGGLVCALSVLASMGERVFMGDGFLIGTICICTGAVIDAIERTKK